MLGDAKPWVCRLLIGSSDKMPSDEICPLYPSNLLDKTFIDRNFTHTQVHGVARTFQAEEPPSAVLRDVQGREEVPSPRLLRT